MKPWTQRVFLATATAALLAGVPAWAHMDKDSNHRQQHMEHMQQRMAERQAELKAALKLTAEQEAAWTRYTEAFRMTQPAAPRTDRQALTQMTTPQRLELMQTRMAERDAHMKRIAEATLALYNNLTPDQQKTFDEKTRMGSMHHGMSRGHHGQHGSKG